MNAFGSVPLATGNVPRRHVNVVIGSLAGSVAIECGSAADHALDVQSLIVLVGLQTTRTILFLLTKHEKS
jgi:hypothetical protein